MNVSASTLISAIIRNAKIVSEKCVCTALPNYDAEESSDRYSLRLEVEDGVLQVLGVPDIVTDYPDGFIITSIESDQSSSTVRVGTGETVLVTVRVCSPNIPLDTILAPKKTRPMSTRTEELYKFLQEYTQSMRDLDDLTDAEKVIVGFSLNTVLNIAALK